MGCGGGTRTGAGGSAGAGAGGGLVGAGAGFGGASGAVVGPAVLVAYVSMLYLPMLSRGSSRTS